MQRTEGALSSNSSACLSLVNVGPTIFDEYGNIVNAPVPRILKVVKFYGKEFLIKFGIKKQIKKTYIIN